MKTILFPLLFLLPAAGIQAQHMIQGDVTDKHNDPLPGVNIREKGTRNGTMTDSDGKFTLTVSSQDAVMVFSFVGYKTQEIQLNGETDIGVTLKEECNVCFFDGRQVDLTVRSGVSKTPLGGEIKISHPVYYRQTVLTANIAYQTDLSDNEFLTTSFGLTHLIVRCDYNADLNVAYRKINWDRNFQFESRSIEGTLHLSGVGFLNYHTYTILYIGYGQADLVQTEKTLFKNNPGYLLGLGTYIGRPLNISVSGKTVYWNDFWEFQGEVKKEIKKLSLSARYLKIDRFDELTLTVGWTFRY
jgi:hypothetical protein